MNRLWIGVGILILLLVAGSGLLWGSMAFFDTLSQEMEACGEAALAENWILAGEEAAQCAKKWERFSHFWASVTDHAPIEQVQLLFSQLDLYARQQLSVEFAVCCRALAEQARAIRECSCLAWWSIL